MAHIAANAFWTAVWKAAVSYAVSAITNKLLGPKQKTQSPTYEFGTLQTQTNNNTVQPIIYGRVKCAGNNIWQSGSGQTVQRIVSFGVGKNNGVSDVKLDDKAIGGLSGCSYTAYMGDGVQDIDSRVTGATQADKARLVGGMKYDSYLALTLQSSDKLSGNPNVTAVWEGRIVRVYTTPSAYTEAWSDNPAWCVLDFMTSYDGCGMAESELDIQSFITAAAYCDELVNGRKRFTLNIILDEKKSRQDWLHDLLSVCRGYFTYQRGKHGILIDKPESVSQIFTVKKTEEIELWWSELSEEYERIIIKYPDPEYEWQLVGAAATIAPPFRRSKPNEKTIDVYGVTNFQQASQLSWFHLNQERTCKLWARYKTNRKALNRSVGEVIGIKDPIMQLTEAGLEYKRFRIMSMTEPQDGTIEMVLREYNEELYTDAMGSVAPTVNVTTLSDPYDAPPDVSAYYVYQNLRQIEHYWTTVGSSVEVRRLDPNNPTWDSGQVIVSKQAGSKFIDTGITTGLLLFGIKAISAKGIYSSQMRTASVYVGSIPASNIIVAFDEFLSLDGTMIGCSAEGSAVNLDVAATWDEATTAVWDESTTAVWGSPTVTEATYVAQDKDLGKVLNSIVSLQDFAYTYGYDILWKYADTQAGLASATWQAFLPGTYKFRWHKWELVLRGDGVGAQSLTKFKVSIDVPDVVLKYPNETVPAVVITDANAGVRIDFPTDVFSKAPTVTGSVISGAGYIIPDTVTKDYMILKATTNGTDRLTGTLHLQIIGY